MTMFDDPRNPNPHRMVLQELDFTASRLSDVAAAATALNLGDADARLRLFRAREEILKSRDEIALEVARAEEAPRPDRGH